MHFAGRAVALVPGSAVPQSLGEAPGPAGCAAPALLLFTLLHSKVRLGALV